MVDRLFQIYDGIGRYDKLGNGAAASDYGNSCICTNGMVLTLLISSAALRRYFKFERMAAGAATVSAAAI